MPYAVHIGRNPGVFNTWALCKKQVNKFKGARFKKFKNMIDAVYYVLHGELRPVTKITEYFKCTSFS